jgi:hypothetical protein
MHVQVTSGLNHVSEACILLVYFTDLIGIVECVPAHCEKFKIFFFFVTGLMAQKHLLFLDGKKLMEFKFSNCNVF